MLPLVVLPTSCGLDGRRKTRSLLLVKSLSRTDLGVPGKSLAIISSPIMDAPSARVMLWGHFWLVLLDFINSFLGIHGF